MICKFTKTILSNVYLNVFIIIMLTQTTPAEIYQKQVDFFTSTLKLLRRKRSHLGWLRLIIVLSILLLVYYLFFNSAIIVWIAVIAGIAVFLYVVSVDTDNSEKIGELERMLAINNEELAILNGASYQREDGLSLYLAIILMQQILIYSGGHPFINISTAVRLSNQKNCWPHYYCSLQIRIQLLKDRRLQKV